ncbi:MAG: alpha/beta hydrolase [Anaerolineae bacterium]|nr:alpha/beta hydrolase [Anaerolineae bacterium]
MLGTLNHHPSFTSRFVDPRPVDVWLPPGYDAQAGARRFAVIYMHDGQNLFDPNKAYAGVDWGIDEAIVRLSQKGVIQEAIVVGIWNTEKRWREYMPQKALDGPQAASIRESAAEELEGGPISDLYLRFMIEEVKPFVDSEYRTLPGRENTGVMGSSMGALISLYALCEYPETFGGAACLSTHWPAAGEALIAYLVRALPRPGQHRLYFDYGTEDVDAPYEPYQVRADAVVRAAGYREGVDWMTCKFPGAGHSEEAWRKRVHIPLQFLLEGRPD